MPAVAPYIPNKNADLANWANNFSTLITASPATYGVLAADAVAIAAQYTLLQAAYNLLASPTTKTKTTVAAFVTVKFVALALIRQYAVAISLNAGVTSGDKVALGINPRTNLPVPIAPPTSNPILSFISSTPGNAIFRYRDSSASPTVKAKPYGVLQIELRQMWSATPVTDPTQIPIVAVTTKSPLQLPTVDGGLGKTIYMAARWVTRKGEYSPFSPIINFIGT